jgi:hypothetical protein
VTGRRGRRPRQLLDALKGTRRYWKSKDRTVWLNGFGRGYDHIVVMMIRVRGVIEGLKAYDYVTRKSVVVTAVNSSITTVFYNLTPFSLVQSYQIFGVTCYICSAETTIFLKNLLPIILTVRRYLHLNLLQKSPFPYPALTFNLITQPFLS